MLQNFRVIMKYNRRSYALAIGHLGDRLRGRALCAAWPRHERVLSRPSATSCSSSCTAGLRYREPDGRLAQSRNALRAFQAAAG